MRFPIPIARLIIAVCVLATSALSAAHAQDGKDAAAALVLAQNTQDEMGLVELDCSRKGAIRFDCACVVQKFRAARESDPEQHHLTLLNEIYKTNDCYDESATEQNYAGLPCESLNRLAKFQERPPVDCACFGTAVARDIGRDRLRSIRKIARVRLQAAEACRN